MVQNIKMRTRMIAGYAVVTVILVISMVIGVEGISILIHSYNRMTELSKEVSLAQEIEAKLYDSRLIYQQFLISGAKSNDHNFDLDYYQMLEKINLLKGATSNNVIAYIIDIEKQLYNYKKTFGTMRTVKQEMVSDYEGILEYGEAMLLALNTLNEEAYIENDEVMIKYAADAVQNLASARIYVVKYFILYEKNAYDQYEKYYALYKESIDNINGVDIDSGYDTSYNIILNSIEIYDDEIEQLHSATLKMNGLITEMNEMGLAIEKNTESVITIMKEERIRLQEDMDDYIFTLAIKIGIAMISAILSYFIVAFRMLKFILRPILTLTSAFEAIAESDGDVSLRLPIVGKDEVSIMSEAFNRFMIKLEVIMENVKFQNRLKTGESDLFERSFIAENMNELSESILSYVVQSMDGIIGRIYIREERSDYFKAYALYGGTLRDLEYKVKSGEGLVGCSIAETKCIVLDNIPNDYLTIETGLAKGEPCQLLIIPCIYDGKVNCVIEIGQFDTFEIKEIEFIEELAEAIANIVNSTELRIHMQSLLDRTVQQSEELQLQQEELRQSNEELEEQTKALIKSEQHLQLQQEELRVSNEELEEYSKQLLSQKSDLDKKNKEIMASNNEITKKAKELEEANRYKSEFLANMSHELRTPLNSIMVLSQLLATRKSDRPLTDKEKEFADTIYTSGSDLLVLINGVLDLAKVEAGKLELLIEAVEIEEIMGGTLRLFKEMAEKKGIDYRVDKEVDIPKTIRTDYMRLNQIIKNLISNALKFTHEGYVKLCIRNLTPMECEECGYEQEKYVAFEVSDTGIGIEKDKQELIFEAFKQTDGTTNRKYGGTGLGLTISLELSKLLEGHILIKSELGKGSSFVLIIPKEYVEDSHLENQGITIIDKVSSDLKQIEMKDTSSEEDTLLIVTGEEKRMDMLKMIAEDNGYQVLMSATSAECVTKAKEYMPCGIILDLELEDSDGVSKKLEKDDGTKSIPIHLMRCETNQNTREIILPKVCAGILKNPIDIKGIYKTLAKIESINHLSLKKILVVGACEEAQFEQFIKLSNVVVDKVLTEKEALKKLKEEVYESLMLDVKLEDMTMPEFELEVKKIVNYDMPIVVYVGGNVDVNESKSDNSIIVKSRILKEQPLDEIMLFLHNIDKKRKGDNQELREDYTPKRSPQVIDKDLLHGEKILIVDDDDRNIFALQNVLEAQGLEVLIARDGNEAIEQYKKDKGIKIILMDIMMPKMDGYEAIGRIRELKGGDIIPIIALTAKAMAEDRKKSIEAGANDYMTKPINVEKLISLIKVWLA